MLLNEGRQGASSSGAPHVGLVHARDNLRTDPTAPVTLCTPMHILNQMQFHVVFRLFNIVDERVLQFRAAAKLEEGVYKTRSSPRPVSSRLPFISIRNSPSSATHAIVCP